MNDGASSSQTQINQVTNRVQAPKTQGSGQSSEEFKKEEQRFKEAFNDNKIDTFKVNEIQDFLKQRDIPSKGIKKFLVTLVKEYFEV